jgi:hypothetical protein
VEVRLPDFESLPLRERIRLLLPYAASDPEVAAELERVNVALEQNPLLGFEPHAAQRDFIQAPKRFDAPTAGWIMVPTEDKIDDSFRPVFEKWCPPSEFLGRVVGEGVQGRFEHAAVQVRFDYRFQDV